MYKVEFHEKDKGLFDTMLIDGSLCSVKQEVASLVRDLSFDVIVLLHPLVFLNQSFITLELEGGKKLPSTNWTVKTKVPSETEDKDYVVTEFDDGHFECTCPHFVYRGVDTCKHMGVE